MDSLQNSLFASCEATSLTSTKGGRPFAFKVCQEIPGSQNMPMMQSPAIFIALATVFRLSAVHGNHKIH